MKFLLFVSTFAIIATGLVSSTTEEYARRINHNDHSMMPGARNHFESYRQAKPTSSYERHFDEGRGDQR